MNESGYLFWDLDLSNWHPHNFVDNVVNIQSFGNMGKAKGGLSLVQNLPFLVKMQTQNVLNSYDEVWSFDLFKL